MKAIIITILSAMLSVCSFAQTIPSTPQPLEQTSVVKLHKTEKAALYYHDYTVSDCSKYHKMKVAGIVLASVGAAMIMTGGIMAAVDYRTVYVNDPGRGPYRPIHPLRAAGGAFVAVGALSVGAGIPLAIIGGVKGHKYCRGGYAPSSYFPGRGDGTGLAYNF
ncbi:MAG: hypothetical protein JST83_10945 [Bacteroidetes bacterium]|nr:hypothetical protein [Bacteroidota bacterium]